MSRVSARAWTAANGPGRAKALFRKAARSLIDVAGEVLRAIGQRQPGDGERVEAAGEVYDAVEGAKAGQRLGVELVKDGQALAGGGVAAHDAPQRQPRRWLALREGHA